MANDLKRKRRMEMGDKDPSASLTSNDSTSGIPAQPMPGMPQGRGNLMNNPQVGQSMGGGAPQPGGPAMFPYNDGGLGQGDPRMGTIGFTQPSGQNENLVPGRRLNSQPYGTVSQVKEGEGQDMMYSRYYMQESNKSAEKSYAQNGDLTPPFQISPMGPYGLEAQAQTAGQVNPGAFPAQMTEQTPGSMPLQGNSTQSLAAADPSAMGPGNTGSLGMNTGRGGGRNQQA